MKYHEEVRVSLAILDNYPDELVDKLVDIVVEMASKIEDLENQVQELKKVPLCN